MSPPLLGVEGGGKSNVSLVPSPTSPESGFKVHNYFGLSDCSSVDSSTVTSLPEDRKDNLKATELRLGLPGSQSPQRDAELCLLSSGKLDEKPLFPLTPLKDGISSMQKTPVSGNKRGFSDTVQESSGQGKLPVNGGINVMLSTRSSSNNGANQQLKMKEVSVNPSPELVSRGASNNNNGVPAAKAQVVGWPPVKSFRKNTLATASKNTDPLFIKVSMDGAPYLRKVDLRTYATYQELSSALEKMFSCFTLGQCGSHGVPTKENTSEMKLKDLLNGSEYVLTYEDKDGDWMLVGDVPWEMFIDSCKRLKIMKSSDAIGLAPRGMEKSKK